MLTLGIVMIIKSECVVSINFSVKDEEENVLESSPPGQPLVYLQGAGNLVLGLEKGLKGMKLGDKKTITVYPEEGFGEVDTSLKLKADKSQFPPEIKIEKDRVLERKEQGVIQRFRNGRGWQYCIYGREPPHGWQNTALRSGYRRYTPCYRRRIRKGSTQSIINQRLDSLVIFIEIEVADSLEIAEKKIDLPFCFTNSFFTTTFPILSVKRQT